MCDVRAIIYHIKARCLTQTTKLKGLYHEKHQNFVAVIALATSFGSFAAQTVTATGSTLESAEAEKNCRQAERAGASDYKITQAYTGNRVHMTAELLK